MVDRICDLIRKKGMSVNAVEKQLNFGNGAIKRFDKNSPSIDKIISLSNFLNVSIDYLVYGKEKSNTNISYSTVGAIDSNLSETVTINNNPIPKDAKSENEEVCMTEQDISDITREIIKVSESLPMRERVKLLGIIYDFEENYYNSNT